MAEVDILVNVRFAPVDQLVPVTLGAVQQGAELFDESCPPSGMGAAEQLFGLFHDRSSWCRAARMISRQHRRPNRACTNPTSRFSV